MPLAVNAQIDQGPCQNASVPLDGPEECLQEERVHGHS